MLMEARSLNWMLGKIYEWANKGVLDQKEIRFFFCFCFLMVPRRINDK